MNLDETFKSFIMKKLLLLILTHLFLLSVTIQAQNNIWSLPPNYYDFNNIIPIQPLPSPPGAVQGNIITGYYPSPAEFCHNAMQDAAGNLLFFIVDGVFYDKDGNYFGDMLFEAPGANEVMIVPDPADCNRYYVFADGVGSLSQSSVPYYWVVDVTNSSAGSIRLDALITPSPLNTFIKNWYNTYAATPIRSDNSRFVFVNTYNTLYQFKIDVSGISFVSRYDILNPLYSIEQNGGYHRSEMEIIETLNSSNQLIYRVAISYLATTDRFIVCNLDLDYNTGTVIQGSEEFQEYIGSSNTENIIHGLEFSPDGNIIYIGHKMSLNHPSSIDFHQIGTGDNSIQALNVTNAQDYQYTQIELGLDGKLYFVGNNATGTNNRLATLDTPNSPNPSNWNDNAILINYNTSLADYVNSSAFPETKLYNLPDQIDGMDYTTHFTANLECCKDNSPYQVASDDNTHEHSNSGVWSDGANDIGGLGANLSSPIRVKDQLIIKSGANITINNMRFEFAPEAQLIIEDGARLTINGTTLTADTRCDSNAMWSGVEVWGGTNPFQPISAGRFITQAYSTIEHAIEATANYQHTIIGGSPKLGSPVAGFNGGIIQLATTTLRNNVYDVYMLNYQSYSPFGGAISDQSRFVDCNFITDAALNDPAKLPRVHAFLYFVDGIRFSGCDFQNTTTSVFGATQRGIGIQSEETRLTVSSRCSSITFPCTNVDKGKFKNLFIGVWAKSGTGVKTATITNNLFDDVTRGVTLRGLDFATVSDNDLNIGANIGFLRSVGLALLDCDQYKVTYNAFHTSYAGYLGCYVDNSGTAANEIYKNTFTDLTIGSQAANINGDGDADNDNAQTGLEFRCNEYYNTSDYDILVSSGRVRSDQGNCLVANIQSPANNKFSYTAQLGDYWLNWSTVTISSTYNYSTGIQLAPRTQTTGFPLPSYIELNSTSEQECTNLPAFNVNNSCPVRLPRKKLQLKQELVVFDNIVSDLRNQIDGGDQQGLLQLIASSANNGNTKNELMDASPYLSDEVLIAYILSGTSNGNLKLVLLENSPLTADVLAELGTINLPKGIRKEINKVQDGVSPRAELENEISYYLSEISKIKSDIIRLLLFDESTPDRTNFKDVAEFLKEDEAKNTNAENQDLVNALIADGNLSEAQQKLITMHSVANNADFCKLKNTVIACQQYPEKEAVLVTNSGLRQAVEEVSTASTKQLEVTSAKVLLEEVGLLPSTQFVVELVTPPNANARVMNTTEETVSEGVIEAVMDIYPNPAKEQFTITHNLEIDNGVVILTVYNLMGKVMLQQKLIDSEEQINAKALKAGIYFYTVTQNNQSVKTDKLVVE